MPIALIRLDGATVTARQGRAFSVVAKSRRVLDAGGRTMTIATTTGGATGQVVTNVSVDRRVDLAARGG